MTFEDLEKAANVFKSALLKFDAEHNLNETGANEVCELVDSILYDIDAELSEQE